MCFTSPPPTIPQTFAQINNDDYISIPRGSLDTSKAKPVSFQTIIRVKTAKQQQLATESQEINSWNLHFPETISQHLSSCFVRRSSLPRRDGSHQRQTVKRFDSCSGSGGWREIFQKLKRMYKMSFPLDLPSKYELCEFKRWKRYPKLIRWFMSFRRRWWALCLLAFSWLCCTSSSFGLWSSCLWKK